MMTTYGVILSVADMPRAVAFYEKVLGTPPSVRHDWHTEFVGSSFALSLAYNGGEAFPPSPGFLLQVRVPELQRLYERFREAGLEVSAPEVEEHMETPTAYLTDPDGYRVQLLEVTAQKVEARKFGPGGLV